jgi:hypothetical protein
VFAAYVVFLVAAISFAAVEVERSRAASDQESAVVALETKYYAAVGKLAESDPATLGYVTPLKVVYVNQNGAPALSRAAR